MPKIIKNGLEYSGVPVEVVTAWAPTSDPVQVKEPLMGNTDISEIGDGSITGAISELNDSVEELNAGLNAYTYYTAQTTLSTTIKFWKHGRFVLFQHDENFEVPAGTEHQIAIIPNGIIPAAAFAFSLAVCNSGAIVGSARIRMHSDGSVKLISSVSGYQEYHVAGIYLTN